MSRLLKCAAMTAAFAVFGSAGTAEAQVYRAGGPAVRSAARPVYYAQPKKVVVNNGAPVRVVQGYPYLDAPLYTSPSQRVPYQVGSTIVTNQAFAPHEMLYPHTYRALYPPYYYKVRGSWFVWPWGVESHDRWELQGTEVKVEYRSKIPLFSRFSKPWFE